MLNVCLCVCVCEIVPVEQFAERVSVCVCV